MFLIINIQANPLNKITSNQKQILTYVYNKGKSYNLEHTLTAIVWQESQFGKFKINLNDPSCGIFHILPRSLINRTELNDTSWNRSRLCERLLVDNDFSFASAVLELKYWQNYWESKHVTNVWRHTVASYNGGYKASINSKYVQNIIKKIQYIKQYKRNSK